MNKKQYLLTTTKNSSHLSAHSPWLMAKRDSATLIQIARDSQQLEENRVTALEILGRRVDGVMEGKLARLSQRDRSTVIKNAACRALHRSQYMRSRQGCRVTKVLENMR